MRSAAEGEHRTGEDVGEAAPLTPLEAMQPTGKGRSRATPAAPAPAASRARTDAGCNPKGVAQAECGGGQCRRIA